jgi:transposase
MERRKRRSFTPEYKAEAVRQVPEGGKSLPQVAKELALTESALRNWVSEADGEKGKDPAGALSRVEREELVRLRKEVRHLEMEPRHIREPARAGRAACPQAAREAQARGPPHERAGPGCSQETTLRAHDALTPQPARGPQCSRAQLLPGQPNSTWATASSYVGSTSSRTRWWAGP